VVAGAALLTNPRYDVLQVAVCLSCLLLSPLMQEAFFNVLLC